MPQFTKRPVTIEAMQYDGTNGETLVEWSKGAVYYVRDVRCDVTTLEGVMRISPTDWVIRGIKGEYYPCRDDIFRESYVPS